MFLKSKRSSRSVDYFLATLSPLEVTRAMHAYLATLDEDRLQGLIERSISRMDDDERAYLEMSPDFGTFLEQNRRALRTLDRDALRAILMPVIPTRSASVDGTEDELLRSDDVSSQLRAALPPVSMREVFHGLLEHGRQRSDELRRMWPAAVRTISTTGIALAVVVAGAIVTAALIFFIVPAGRAALSWAKPGPAVIAVAPAARPPAAHRTVVHARVRHAAPAKLVVAQHTAPATATPAPTPRATATPVATPKATATQVPVAKPDRIAQAAKARARAHEAALRRIAAMKVARGTMPSHEPALVQRARLIVMSYLDSLMRGDASSALGNLGLSASAGTSNLTEAPILAGATEFRVVRAGMADASSAKVQVVIDSPQGRYFGDYIVSANGPAAWITQHEVIPIETTVARHS